MGMDLLGFGSPLPASALAPLPADTAAAVQRAFGSASERLLGWPQETGGLWIDRPELDQLHALALAPEPPVTVLLGEPGVGKSALLARLGCRLQAEGVALLALKADQLPRDVGTLAALEREIGAPLPVTDALRRLAAERPTLLLIDQLDALADLMDQHSDRLSALLRLVHEVREVPNLVVILSCRAFEFRYDPRLTCIKAESLILMPPAWDQIQPLLDARGLDSGGWSQEVKEVLRTPQHLALFVGQLAALGEPVFASYHAMLDAVFDRLSRRYGDRIVESAEQLAIAMATDEELSLGRARFSATYGAELTILEREGLLRSTGSAVAFRHQTVFDFLRSRAFLRTGTSLADFVIRDKQESLFVRPTLWSALAYLRANDRAAYRQEFRRLWVHDGLRLHLRELLAGFLGQVADPDDEEARWLLPRLDDPAVRHRTLNAMAGRAGWFRRLKPRLPTLMGAPPDEAWCTVWFLTRALEIDSRDVIALVDQHWSRDPSYAEHTRRVLEDFRGWDEQTVALAERIVSHPDVNAWTVRSLAKRVADTYPALAPRVVARNLEARLEHVLAHRPMEPEPPPADAPDAERFIWLMARDRARFDGLERMLDSRSEWHDLEKLVEGAPRCFLEALWPWLLRVLDALVEDRPSIVIEYRQPHGLAFQNDDDEDDRSFERPLHTALMVAARGFAVAEPDAFLALADANRHRDMMVVHRLLAAGFTAIAAVRSQAALAYLLEDNRRLAIGPDQDVHRDSKRLIAALAPSLGPENVRRLEEAILGWEHYHPRIPDEDAATRMERRKWTRQHRLRLLSALPREHMTEIGRRRRAEEERAFPHTRDYDIGKVQTYWVGSVVPAERMPRLSDDAIVALFEMLTDDARRHPKQPFGPTSGGSVEASRAFEELAKAYPERALRIIERFQPGRQERPTSTALRVISGNKDLPGEVIARTVHELDARGFASEEFRWDAARSLEVAAGRTQGLPDSTIAMLEGWLTDWKAPPDRKQGDAATVSRRREGDHRQSLLWGIGGAIPVPHGNYPALAAITAGLLCRKPMDTAGLLDVLERHLDRPEDPDVWAMLLHDLPAITQAGRPRAEAFFDRLFGQYPGVLASRAGALLIAHIVNWLSPDRLASILNGWIYSPWPAGPQAAGEIATLVLCRQPNDPARRERVECYIDAAGELVTAADGLRSGVAYTLAHAWRHPPLRTMVTDLFLRLIPHAKDLPLTETLHHLVDASDPVPPDNDTKRILHAFTRHPHILAVGHGHFIGDRLKDLLACGFDPETIYGMATAMVAPVDAVTAGSRPGWLTDPGDLVDIALALHRLHETRSRGLDLFERLLLLDLGESGGRLKDLDRQPFK